MTARDCTFLVGYLSTYLAFVLFLVSFSRPDWMTHEHGHSGLWMECFKNESVSDEIHCSSSAKAEGPAYLELTRTLEIFALVFCFMGTIGYICFPTSTGYPQTCWEQVKARMQELSNFIAGVLTVLALVSYGLNYHKYYTDEKDFIHLEPGPSFYMACTTSGILLICSMALGCSRDTGLKMSFERKMKAMELKKQKANIISIDSKKRNDWLKNKTVPTPAPSEQKKEEDDANDLAVVKESALKKIINTSNVVLAFNRIKSGKRWKEEQEEIDRTEKDIEYQRWRDASKLEDAESKYKGIFSVEGETQYNKPILSPLSLGRMSSATPTPRSARINTFRDATSTSSSSSLSSYTSSSSDLSSSSEDLMVTAQDGAILPSANATAAAIEDAQLPRNPGYETNPASVFDNTKTSLQRQKVRRSVTTLKDNDQSKAWAVNHAISETEPKAIKTKTRRHMSHDAATSLQKKSNSKGKAQKATPSPSEIPGKSIYSLPTDGAHPAHLPPPQYEEVIGSYDHRSAPQPAMTDQSQVYQPYSKS